MTGRTSSETRDHDSGAGFPDKKVMAELTAKMLLEVEAVRFMTDKPFIFTSGRASPVYTDCRRLISFPRVRTTLIDFACATLMRDAGFEQFDAVAGGETAGIPFAAWMADRLGLPMLYVRKKAEGLRPQRPDRGPSGRGPARAAGRGHDHRRRQQGQLLQRAARGRRQGRPCLVFFFYDIFPEGRKILAISASRLHYLATWWDVLAVAKASGKFDAAKLAEVEKFMHDPPAGRRLTAGRRWRRNSARLGAPSPACGGDAGAHAGLIGSELGAPQHTRSP